MKKLYTFLVLAFTVFIGNAQTINIPDTNFKAKLLLASPTQYIAYNASGTRIKIDTNGNGSIQLSEALLVYKLYVTSANIVDLTGIESFTNLKVLGCGSNPLLTTINLSTLVNLEELSISYDSFTSLNATTIPALKILNCESNDITSLDLSNNTALTSLICSRNQLTSINVAANIALTTLNCSSNQLANLDVSANTVLNTLTCDRNLLTSLNFATNAQLQNVQCNYNQLTSLNFPNCPNLIAVGCSYNAITSFSLSHPLALTENLNMYSNQMQTHNFNQYTNLKYLIIGKNPFTSLNIDSLINLQSLNLDYIIPPIFPLNDSNLPSFIHLEELGIHHCEVGNFNFHLLPALLGLGCRYNGMTAINVNSCPSLERLDARNNQLTSFDASGHLDKFMEIALSDNNISTLTLGSQNILWNILLGGTNNLIDIDLSSYPALNWVQIYNNPTVRSFNIKNGVSEGSVQFPTCPNLQYICADDDQITTLQNSITTYGYTNCHVNTYCTFEPGGTFYTIQGSHRFDANLNGCDINDLLFPHLKFYISNGTTSTYIYSKADGTFKYDVPAGTYQVYPMFVNSSLYTITPASLNVTFPATASPVNQDFCVKRNGAYNDLSISLYPVGAPIAGGYVKYVIVYKNNGNYNQQGSVNLNFDSSVMGLLFPSPAVSSSATNSLTWNFTNLIPLEERTIEFTMHLSTPSATPPLNINHVLHFIATVNGYPETSNSVDNTATLNQTVVASHDPNDKVCAEGITVSPSTVGQDVHYVIHFENTGTANAQNVVVTDLIDTNQYNLQSLIPESGSHAFSTRITSNKVEFFFENINLPFDDANNDGYVAFKIKTKSTLVVGDTFSNNANIYFDYNFPITTNTATTTIATLGTQDFEFGTVFSLSPVPAKNVLTITTKQNVVMSSVSIYNTLGQLVQISTNPNENIDVSGLKTGSYFIKIVSDKGTASSKFVKE